MAKAKPKKKEKLDPVQVTMAGIREKLGKTSAMLLSEGLVSDIDVVIPTGIEVLDNYIFGIGGLPGGRLIEVFSEEGAGKTSFILQCLGSCQQEGGVAILAEAEKGLDKERAKVFGCDLDQVINLTDVDSIEGVMRSIRVALESVPDNIPCLIAFDSIAAAPTMKEIEEGLEGGAKMAEKARILSEACRVLCPLAAKKNAVLLFVNQTRDKVGVFFGDNTTTPGGKGVKFHASVRLQLFSGKAVKKTKEGHVGKAVTFMAVKNKINTPWRKVQVRLMYDTGWDNVWSTVTHAKDQKVIDAKLQAIPKSHRIALKKLGWAGTSVDEPEEEEIDGNESS